MRGGMAGACDGGPGPGRAGYGHRGRRHLDHDRWTSPFVVVTAVHGWLPSSREPQIRNTAGVPTKTVRMPCLPAGAHLPLTRAFHPVPSVGRERAGGALGTAGT